VRLSIAARVSIACATVIVLALLVLATGFTVGRAVHSADMQIARLSQALAGTIRRSSVFAWTSVTRRARPSTASCYHRRGGAG
jgi:hypothetical protein